MKQLLLKAVIGLGIVAGLTGCNLVTYEEEQVYTLDAGELDSFVIDQDQGDVSIIGVAGTTEITVTSQVAVTSEEMEEAEQFAERNLSLELTSEGATGYLTTAVHQENATAQGGQHLTIEVPQELMIEYKQNEGELSITDLAGNVEIQHGRGSMKLERLQGNVTISDGAGTIDVVEMAGDLSINANAGTITIADSVGNVKLIAGSGHVDISNQEGSVSVRSGSGNVTIDSVSGDVTILENRDGTLTLDNIGGTITEPEQEG
ncbi:hypothetical protein M3202_12590 [Alkalihalobacillus oceani]|uniref:Adhesin domain-containing protein n=1 Tax=Halalkalibacter oceani TaxID=1653776 RepID=A0A9X2DR31_9BACI|nr:hypothetical protein [Halalkalibacter oceani]MCM3714918.1 hypothetical protein [Halalkalibacter oceani]